MSEDLAGRKHLEETQRESEEKFRGIFENSALGIALVNPSDGKPVEINPSLKRMLGYSDDELKKMSYQEFTHPDDVEKDSALLQEIYEGRRDYYTLEKRYLRKDGSLLWGSLTVSVIRDQEGKPLYGIALVEDITERKETVQALRKLTKEQQIILDSCPAAIWFKDTENKILRVNKTGADSVGMPVEDIVGKTAYELFPDEAEKYYQDDVEVMESGKPKIGIVEQLQTKSGEKIWVQTDKVPYLDDQNNNAGLIVFVVDITERKRAEEEREKLEIQIQHTQKLESLGVLAGGIAHDFNNILTSILGNTELALMKLAPDSEARRFVEPISTATRRAADLANQMLAYSGKGKFLVRPVDLNNLVKEMTHLLEVSISKSVTSRYDLALDLPQIEADATQIRQVLLNLITNASEAIGDKSGFITISTGVVKADKALLSEVYLGAALPEGDYVYLDVSDTGVGMDEETKEKVFDPFFSTKFAGRGLGLAVVLGIVRSHKGGIRLTSERGEGTTFKVLLPATEYTAEASPRESKAIQSYRGSGYILVVDDEESVRTVTKHMLEEFDFEVLTAKDGREGVRIFCEHAREIQTVLLDMTMPHMSGEETFRQVCQVRSDVPVILMSGFDEQDATKRFTEKGLAGFIQKPFRLRSLIDTVQEVLGRKNA